MEYTIAQMQKANLKVLVFIDEFCKKHNIEYFIAYGTLIGAIRHKGFIPWDDDIDIWMKRDEYTRFVKLMQTENDDPFFYFESHEIRADYPENFGRVYDRRTKVEQPYFRNQYLYGIYVDVFPLDVVPADRQKAKKHYDKCRLQDMFRNNANYRYFLPKNKHKAIRHIFRFIGRLRPTASWTESIQKKVLKYDNEPTGYVGSVAGVTYFEHMKAEWFDKAIPVELEGKQFPAPVGYDPILRSIYGDYMQLPPEEKRKSEHSFVVVDLGDVD